MKNDALGTPENRPVSNLEREQRRAFAEILLEEIAFDDLLRARERWEVLCEERGWSGHGETCAISVGDARLIDKLLDRATSAANAMPDEPKPFDESSERKEDDD